MRDLSKSIVFDAPHFDAAIESAQNPAKIFREALSKGKQSLQRRFEENDDIDLLVHESALLIDELLKRAWRQFFSESTQSALIAVGGYGRSELHPGSDVDLLLLFSKEVLESSKGNIESFLTMLWDIGMEVGQSVRTIEDCVRESKKDVTVITNLIESRFLTGSEKLFEEMQEKVSTDHLWPSDEFFEAKWNEQQHRHLRYGDTANKLEPNIKEGPGGLRDIQMIGWVAIRHFNTRDLHELVKHDFLSEDEFHFLLEGQRFLWKIRFALHIHARRREDRLLFDYQKTLAHDFGYKDNKQNLAVEQFMQQYYRTVMELDRLNEMLLQNFQEEILYSADPVTPKAINRRFQLTRGFIEVVHPNIFRYFPYALLEIFLLLQLDPKIKGVRASTIRLIRASRGLMDDEARNDLRTRSVFLEILKQPTGITHELRRMNRYGILAAYLPAFANITGRMQYDLFHIYTVDEHILFVVRNLRRFTVPEFRNEFRLCSEIISNIAKPELLYIAGLYHDIAKGRGGDHSELGETDTRQFCLDHGLGQYDTNLVAWLVRNHLLMSMTAQQKDISDPEVIREFANTVGDSTHLDYIYLLTVADIRATNPALWNSWKDSLLKELYHATNKALRMSSDEYTSHQTIIASKKADAYELLNASALKHEQIDHIWSDFGPDYFIQYSAEEIAWHITSISTMKENSFPMICVRYDDNRGSTAIFIYGPLKAHQFTATTATLEKSYLNVVDARILSTRSNYTLDTYLVLENDGKSIKEPSRLNEIKEALKHTLRTENPVDYNVNRMIPRQHKHFEVNTRISYTLDKNNSRTILEVTTADRPGLLSRIGEAFKRCEIDLQNAKIATIGMRIEDFFYITDKNNRPLDDQQFNALRDTLLELLDT